MIENTRIEGRITTDTVRAAYAATGLRPRRNGWMDWDASPEEPCAVCPALAVAESREAGFVTEWTESGLRTADEVDVLARILGVTPIYLDGFLTGVDGWDATGKPSEPTRRRSWGTATAAKWPATSSTTSGGRPMSDQDTRRAQMPEGFQSAMRQVAWQARQMAQKAGGRIEADDLAQEGFLALVQAKERWDCHRGVSFATFAMIRAHGAMVDYCRKHSGWWRTRKVRHLELVSVDDVPEADLYHDGPEQVIVDHIEGEAILAAIEGLPPREARIIRGRAAGKTFRELANAEGISMTRTAEILWRGRHRLAAKVGR